MASQAHAGPSILLGNGLNSNNLPVPDVDLEIADSSTMAVAHGRDNFVLDVSLLFVHIALLFGRNSTPRTDVVILAETVITANIKLIITTSLSYGNFDTGCILTFLADIFDTEDFVTKSTILHEKY